MTDTTLLVLARSLHFAGAMLLFALPFFAGWTLRPARAGTSSETCAPLGRTLRNWFWAALVIEALSGAAWFWFVAAQLSGSLPWGLPDPGDLSSVLWQTQFGRLWLGRAVVLAVLFALTAVAPGGASFLLEKNQPLRGLFLFVSGALLVSLAWAGHAAAGINERSLHLAADTLHLLLGAVWPMGLVPFALFLRQTARSDDSLPTELARAVIHRFSQTSFAAVFVLLATGAANAWFLVGSWAALVGTDYGRWLLVKITVTLLMLGLGAWNRQALLPRLTSAAAAGPVHAALRRSVMIEASLAGIVLLIVGVMGMTPPPQ